MVTKETLDEAITFAAKAHRGDYRKGSKLPYITHPMSVMNRVNKFKSSSNPFLLAVCAVLHDTVEDCGVTLDEIAKLFSYQVAAIVDELTLDKRQYELIGKTKYLCQELTRMSSYALCIKLCDRADNLEDMKMMTIDFQERYLEETREILSHLVANRQHLTKTHALLISELQSIMRQAKHDLRNIKRGN